MCKKRVVRWVFLTVLFALLLSPYVVLKKQYSNIGIISIFPKTNDANISQNNQAYLNPFVPLIINFVNTQNISGTFNYALTLNNITVTKIVLLDKHNSVLNTINIISSHNNSNKVVRKLDTEVNQVAIYTNDSKVYKVITIPPNTNNLKLLSIINNDRKGGISLYFSNYVIKLSSYMASHAAADYSKPLLYNKIYLTIPFAAYIEQGNNIVDTELKTPDNFWSSYLPKQSILKQEKELALTQGFVAKIKLKKVKTFFDKKHPTFSLFKIFLVILIASIISSIVLNSKKLISLFCNQPIKDRVVFIILALFFIFILAYFKTQLFYWDIVQGHPLYGTFSTFSSSFYMGLAYINTIIGLWFFLFLHCLLLFLIIFTLYKTAVKIIPVVIVLIFIIIFLILPTTWELILSAQRIFTANVFLLAGVTLCICYFISYAYAKIKKSVDISYIFCSFIIMLFFVASMLRVDFTPFMLIPFLLIWLSKKITLLRSLKIFVVGLFVLILIVSYSILKINRNDLYNSIPIIQALAPYVKYYPKTFTKEELNKINSIVSVNTLINNYSPLSIDKIVWDKEGLMGVYNTSKEDHKALRMITLKHIISNPYPFLYYRSIYMYNMLVYPTKFWHKGYWNILIVNDIIPIDKVYYNKLNLYNYYINNIWQTYVYNYVAVVYFYIILLLVALLYKYCKISATVAISILIIQLIVLFLAGEEVSSSFGYSYDIINLSFVILFAALIEVTYSRKRKNTNIV